MSFCLKVDLTQNKFFKKDHGKIKREAQIRSVSSAQTNSVVDSCGSHGPIGQSLPFVSSTPPPSFHSCSLPRTPMPAPALAGSSWSPSAPWSIQVGRDAFPMRRRRRHLLWFRELVLDPFSLLPPFAPNVSEVRTLAWTSEYERISAQFYHEFRCRIFRYGLFFPVHSRCVLLSSNQNQSGEANRAHAEISAGV